MQDATKRVPRSISKLFKRQGEELDKTPAAKAAKKNPSQTTPAANPDRPTTGGKSPSALKILSESSERSQKKAPDASTASKGGQPPNVATGAATTREEDTSKPHPETQGKNKIEIPWPLDFMRVKTKVDPSGGSVSSRQRMNANYAASLSPSTSFGADLTSDEPDLPGFAKRMVRTLTRSEKSSVPNLQVVDFDRIMGQLAEVNSSPTQR